MDYYQETSSHTEEMHDVHRLDLMRGLVADRAKALSTLRSGLETSNGSLLNKNLIERSSD